jgi:hypothetical protein
LAEFVCWFSLQVMGVPGGDLNYDETVVYDDRAIRPVYLITYGTVAETPGKLKKRKPSTAETG